MAKEKDNDWLLAEREHQEDARDYLYKESSREMQGEGVPSNVDWEDREGNYREWRSDNYTEMNDGTYQSHDGRNVDESEMREHYDRQPELERDYSWSR